MFGRVLVDFGSILRYSGDHLGMIRACSGWFPGLFYFGKIDLYKCSKNRFVLIGVSCAEKNRKVRCLVPVQK